MLGVRVGGGLDWRKQERSGSSVVQRRRTRASRACCCGVEVFVVRKTLAVEWERCWRWEERGDDDEVDDDGVAF